MSRYHLPISVLAVRTLASGLRAFDTNKSAVVTSRAMQRIALAVAMCASAISLQIAMLAGTQRAGTVTEQVLGIAAPIKFQHRRLSSCVARNPLSLSLIAVRRH
ncbi:protein of unknown function [Burkholderia multivorans]